jgi:SRSO17 transposase
LYLPRCWTDDPDRRTAAGVPVEVGFATKPTLARRMIARTLAVGVPARWVTADEVHGADPGLRTDLERRGLGYVLAVARDHRVPTAAGPIRADMLTLQLPARARQPLSARPGIVKRCRFHLIIHFWGGSGPARVVAGGDGRRSGHE